jgi:predicted phosphodiesterase
MTSKKTSGLSGLAQAKKKEESSQKMLGSIADLLKRKNIDIEEIGDIKKVSIYQTVTKDEMGETEIHDLTAIQFSPSWESGPAWPVIQQGPAVQLQKTKTKPKAPATFKDCVILPDIQLGYFRNKKGELEPTHDEKAIDVSLAITKDVNPDLVVLLGDNLDLPEMGKYVTYPSYAQTTQATIDRATMLCAQIRNAAPNAKIIWLAGNHEERMPKFIVQNATAAYGLRKGNSPDSWPVLSVPYLCRMDEFDIEYRPGYPAADLWVNKKLRIIHGDRVKSSGSTAHVYLNAEKTSVVYGHIHRMEQAFKTREDYDGPRTVMAASPGCLARIDGAIPSTRGGVDLDGRPLTRHENWQQGLAVVKYEEKGSHRFTYHNIPIYNGWTMFGGKEYSANG